MKHVFNSIKISSAPSDTVNLVQVISTSPMLSEQIKERAIELVDKHYIIGEKAHKLWVVICREDVNLLKLILEEASELEIQMAINAKSKHEAIDNLAEYIDRYDEYIDHLVAGYETQSESYE